MYNETYIKILLSQMFDHITNTFQGDEELLFVALKGSQNYDLDTIESDFDFVGVILKDLHQSIFPKYNPTKRYLETPYGCITLITYTEFCQMLCKQNPSFLEILFTKYREIHPLYENQLQPLFEHAETLSSWNFYKQRTSMLGQITERIKEYHNETAQHKTKKAAKHLAMGYYLYEFLTRRTDNYTMHECYSITNFPKKTQEFLIKLKNNQIPAQEQFLYAQKLQEMSADYHEITKNKYYNHTCPTDIQNILVSVYKDCILTYLQKGDTTCN